MEICDYADHNTISLKRNTVNLVSVLKKDAENAISCFIEDCMQANPT